MSAYSDAVLADGPVFYTRLGSLPPVDVVAGRVIETPPSPAPAWVSGPSLLAADPDDAGVRNTQPPTTQAWVGTVGAGLWSGGAASALTVEGWYRAEQLPAVADRGLFHVSNGALNVVHARVLPSGDITVQRFRTIGYQNFHTIAAAVDLLDGEPHHVVFTWMGEESVLYIDGYGTALPAWGPPRSVSNVTARWGHATWEATRAWVGGLDELAVYDRALPADRVLAHYEAGATPPPDDPPPGPASAGSEFFTVRLADRLGLDPETAQPVYEVLTAAPGDPVPTYDADTSRALIGFQVVHGRQGATGPVDPLTASLELVTARAELPEIGGSVVVRLSSGAAAELGGVDPVRFAGVVTDKVVSHDRRTTQLTCVGAYGARTGRLTLDPATLPDPDGSAWSPRPAGEAVAAVLAGTPSALARPLTGGRLVTFPDRPTTVRAYLDQLQTSDGGSVVELTGGTVDYHAPDYRRARPVAALIPTARIDRRASWEQHVTALANRVHYVHQTGEATVTDYESVRRYGTYEVSEDTVLTSAGDAYDRAAELVGRYGDPAWTLPNLVMTDPTLKRAADPETVYAAQLALWADLLQLRHGDLIELAGPLPPGWPVPRRVYVEGYIETVTPRRWSLALQVSDPRLSGTALRWVDLPAASGTWEDVPVGVTWLDAATMTDPSELFF